MCSHGPSTSFCVTCLHAQKTRKIVAAKATDFESTSFPSDIIMSYHRNQGRGRRGLFGMPSSLGDLSSIVTELGIAADLSNDPYLHETVCRVGQMRSLNRNQPAGTCVATADHLPGGVGLSKLIKPLRGYVYSLEHKWVAPAVVLGVLGAPMLLGYLLGKGR